MDEKDGEWKKLGLAAPARRALINGKLLKLSDLKKISLEELRGLHGMGPKAITLLLQETKKHSISFKK